MADSKDKKSRLFGAGLTVAVHLLVLLLCLRSAMKPQIPENHMNEILMEFEREKEPEPEPVVEQKYGREPQSAAPTPKKPVELVQKSEARHEGKKLNQAEEATVGDKGDVEVPEPPREKPIDKRALFSAADNSAKKDTLAAQTAAKVSNALAAGHPEGNTRKGKSEGEPSARLEGRTVVGGLPVPSYTIQDAGKVVVKITVDRQGKVTSAIPGYTGTSVTSRTLWNAAKEAALKARFNVSSTAPEIQEGTITYIFKLH